ncbi:MAG TPA: BREX system serine/threonine kinase PglW [Acidimicrobiales bacterium]|nr:BREX system serine/threonine kinase PglW [Acidimicrobiales bacterium]
MDANSVRWHRVTPSTFPWEDEAIEFLRSRIADADPNRAWSNFEFIAGGVISEVDVFLLTRKGAYLVEIKSTPGRLVGDQQRWTFHKPGGGRTTMENPLLGANRKAKRIKSLLEHKWRAVAPANASPSPPFIQPVVFLSDPELEVGLTRDARVHVYGRDDSAVTASGELAGIVAATVQIGAVEANDPRFRQLNTPTTTAVAKALEAIGIKESDRTQRVGSWVLRLDTVTERPGLQDFVADHATTKGVTRRIRIYSRQPGMSDEQAQSLRAAAEREFLATERLDHPNVVKAQDRLDTDLGSAVVFPYDAKALRLDHWLAEQPDADLDDRLAILRQLAETLQVVHRRKVTHRALSPGSVLVRPGRDREPRWVVLVTDFSLAGRDHPSSTASHTNTSRTGTRFGLPTAAPGDVELLADETALRYQAPELFTDDEPDGVSLDVFSYGAIAYHVLSGRSPGDTREAVRQVLQTARGLQLSTAVPGVAGALHELVYSATRPLVSERLSSMEDVLVHLDLAEEELTAPQTITTDPALAPPPKIDPLDAKIGDQLGDGAVVKRRLGRGSTALALLVDRSEGSQPQEAVYKVALSHDAAPRLRDEARILEDLEHAGIVKLFGEIELAGRPVLVEALAGTQSLADELRRNGTPGLEFLQRWGTDLLDALRYLERKGRSHRDIKPGNLGVTQVGSNREQHLVLFDFSLAGTPASDIRAGTPPYLDPFLGEREPKAWDLAAERYAAAVTLYEMATGEVPRWGDGRSDPAFTLSEVTLDTLLLDPAIREPLSRFFATALRRAPGERFGNAEDMAIAWAQVFAAVDQPAEPAKFSDEPADDRRIALPDAIAVDDPISSLGASGRITSALARLDVATIRQLAALSPMAVNQARRISPRVRRRIIELRAALLVRFADELNAERGAPTPGAPAGAVDDEHERLDLDALLPLLVPPAAERGRKGSTGPAVRLLLGLDTIPTVDTAKPDWASQSAVAEALQLTRGRLGQIAPAARQHWAELDELRSVRDDLVGMLAANGGVMAIRELDALVLETRGSGLALADATRAARAVVRAAVDSEPILAAVADGTADARFVVRRRGDRVVVALDGDELGDDVGAHDGQGLAAYAIALGERADEVVGAAADVIPQDRAVTLLRAVAAPDEVALPDGRLVRLAAASSLRVGVSAALELYPVDLDPVRALRLSRQAFAAADALTVADVHDRMRARFPDVILPDRPLLDDALADAEVVLTWSPERDAYVRTDTTVGGLSSLTSIVRRKSTRLVQPERWRQLAPDVDPAVAVADEIEGRLERSLDHGGFLVLRVPTSRGAEIRRGLTRFTAAPHEMVSVDLERWFIEELRAEATSKRVSWDRILDADVAEAGTTAHTNLGILTATALDRLELRVFAAGSRVLAWNPGILARYDEKLGVLDRLRDRAGRADVDLQTLWLVVFGSTADPKPMLDGQSVPVLGPSEWVDITDAWLENRHRHHPPTGTDGQLGGGA